MTRLVSRAYAQPQSYAFLEEFTKKHAERENSRIKSRGNQAFWTTLGIYVTASALMVASIQYRRYRHKQQRDSTSLASSNDSEESVMDFNVFGPNVEWTPLSIRKADNDKEDDDGYLDVEESSNDEGPRMLTSYSRQLNNSDKPTIVIIHGFGCTSLEFNTLRQKLTDQEFNVFLFDRIVAVKEGQNASSSLALPRSGETIAHELYALLCNRHVLTNQNNKEEETGTSQQQTQENATSNKVILLGHSYGGLIAQRFAMLYPQQVAGMILLDPAHERQNDYFPLDFALSFKVVPFILRSYELLTGYLPGYAHSLFTWMNRRNIFNFPPLFLMPRDSPERKTALQLYSRQSASWRRARYELLGCNETFKTMPDFWQAHSPHALSKVSNAPISLVLANNRKYSPTFFPQAVTVAFRDMHMDLQMTHDVELLMANDSDHWIHLQNPNVVMDGVASVMRRINNKQKDESTWVALA